MNRTKNNSEYPLKKYSKICFFASSDKQSQIALEKQLSKHKNHPIDVADVIVVLGGDGFLLNTLVKTREWNLPVYGMNCGTIGFLMNRYSSENLQERLELSIEQVINPLRMEATDQSGNIHIEYAINEVAVFRSGPQAVKLKIFCDNKVRLPELVCDGALVATPAGSTAYNYSAHGPILPIGSEVLALTAMAAFRPRRWRGALLPFSAVVKFEVLEAEKRLCMAEADGRSVPNISSVKVAIEPKIKYRLCFDEGHGLEERMINEQFY